MIQFGPQNLFPHTALQPQSVTVTDIAVSVTADGQQSTVAPVGKSGESAANRGYSQQFAEAAQQQKAEPPAVNGEQKGSGKTEQKSAVEDKEGPQSKSTQSNVTASEPEDKGRENGQSAQTDRAEQQQDAQLIRELKARDLEVRLHEQAHAAVGGRYAGPPRFEYERGPDGVRYAVGGEVNIEVSPVPNDPQATLEKARIIRAAALAPADPSPQDRAVAAEAARMAAEAQAELAQARQMSEEINGEEESADTQDSGNLFASETEEEPQPKSEEREAAEDEEQERAIDRFKRINGDQQSFMERLISLGVIDADQPTGGLLDQIV